MQYLLYRTLQLCVAAHQSFWIKFAFAFKYTWQVRWNMERTKMTLETAMQLSTLESFLRAISETLKREIKLLLKDWKQPSRLPTRFSYNAMNSRCTFNTTGPFSIFVYHVKDHIWDPRAHLLCTESRYFGICGRQAVATKAAPDSSELFPEIEKHAGLEREHHKIQRRMLIMKLSWGIYNTKLWYINQGYKNSEEN